MAFVDYRTWVTGELVGASHFNQDVRDNGKELWRELAQTNQNGTFGLTTTAVEIVSLGAITYAARPTVIEWGVAYLQDDGANEAQLAIYDAATPVLTVARHHTTGSPTYNPASGIYRFTPTAASHTYRLLGVMVAGTGSVQTWQYIRVTQRNG